MNRLIAYLGIPAVAVGAITATWAATDYLGVRPVIVKEFNELKQVVGSNQEGVQLIRWQILHEQAKAGTISPSDRLLYCKLSRKLGLEGIGCS